jgi:hypothetical protein
MSDREPLYRSCSAPLFALVMALLLGTANRPAVLSRLGSWNSLHNCGRRRGSRCGDRIHAAFYPHASNQSDYQGRSRNQRNPETQQPGVQLMQERIQSILPLFQRLREPVVCGLNLSNDSAVCITQIAERGREFLLCARHRLTGSLQASGCGGQARFKEILA